LLLVNGSESVGIDLPDRVVGALVTTGCVQLTTFTVEAPGEVSAAVPALRRPLECLTLTLLGLARVQDYLGPQPSAEHPLEILSRLVAALLRMAEWPLWKESDRELWWHGTLLKQFRHDAAYQRCVLAAFQAAGWPSRIDDPLPRRRDCNRKQHLRETIKSLNRGLHRRALRFRSDGAASGVRWEAIA